MVNIKGSVGLIGYGVSNKALCAHLIKKGIFPVVRCPAPVPLPQGVTGVFGDGYLDILEETVFRSPGIHPHKINKTSYTEVEYGLGLTNAYKIGVTGSDGKTTTSTLISLMLAKGGRDTVLSGNIGKP